MNYRARLATNRRKEIETHRYFLLFQEYLNHLQGDTLMDLGKMAIQANVREYKQKLEHFYSTSLSGEYRDRLEKKFDQMNAYHRERTGEVLFDENPVSVSKDKLIPR